MGKKIKWILAIVLFPIVIFYLFTKWILIYIKKAIYRAYLSRIDIQKIDAIDGWEFEELIEQIFAIMGFKITRTPKTKDYGADLIIKYKKLTFAVQCKLYYKHNVGNSAIQEIATAREYYQTDGAIVITNSYYSKPATKLANTVGVQLLDRMSLINILQRLKYREKQPLDIIDISILNHDNLHRIISK